VRQGDAGPKGQAVGDGSHGLRSPWGTKKAGNRCRLIPPSYRRAGKKQKPGAIAPGQEKRVEKTLLDEEELPGVHQGPEDIFKSHLPVVLVLHQVLQGRFFLLRGGEPAHGAEE